MTRGELARLMEALRSAGRKMTDNEALQAPICFPVFTPGETLAQDTRVRYAGDLYRVRQTHTAEHTPDTAPALFELIEWQHSGTLADPIPWRSGLVCEYGAYYTENGITYRGMRDSGQPLYYSCADLIGVYFQALD